MLRVRLSGTCECVRYVGGYLIYFDFYHTEVIRSTQVVLSFTASIFHSFGWSVSEAKVAARVFILISKVIECNVIAKLNVHIFLMVDSEIPVLILLMFGLMGQREDESLLIFNPYG